MTACVNTAPTGTEGICGGLRGPVGALENALLAHPETPDAVGEAAVDVIIARDAGCKGG